MHPVPIDIEQSIAAGFELQVERNPEGLAIRHAGRDISYGELNRSANRLARAILEVCPAGEAVIAGLFPPGESGILAMLAVWKAGKIWAPLDPSAPAARLREILAEAQAALLLVAGETALSAGPPCPMLDLREARDLPDGNLGLATAPEASASIVFTSGSTGRPKGVVHLHRNLLHNAGNHTAGYGIGREDRILPNGLADLLTALMNGASLFPFSSKQDGLVALKERLLEDRISVWTTVPTTLRRFTGVLSGAEQFPALRLIKLAGETIHSQDIELCRKYFSSRLVVRPALAMTEAGMVCAHLIRAGDPAPDGVVPVGYPVEGKEVLFLDEDGLPVEDGASGEIAIRSRYLPAGYWRRPELTAARFLADPNGGDRRIYLTGDLGRRRPDGLIEHLGRKDAMVKIRANRVELPEVESALQALDGVTHAAVLALHDPSGQPALYGYFTASGETSRAALLRDLRGRLPDYMVPSSLVRLDQMPLLPNGKVDRRALAQIAPERAEERPPAEPPRTAREHELARLWCELLSVGSVGAQDNFFDLGGNSLLAMEAAARMEKQTGVRVSPVTVAAQTLRQWAAIYDGAPRAGGGTALPAASTEQPFFLDLADRRLWCVYHAPQARARGGIALCQPFGWEYYTCRHCCRGLAQKLAQAGFAVLRFDYFGTGDSSGDCAEARIGIWMDDIGAALDELERRGHPCRGLVGLRFGATLAARFAAGRGGIPALVLWEPVADGARHLQELQAREQAQLPDAETVPGGLLGLMVAPELRAGISSTRLTRPAGGQVLLLDAAGVPEPAFWNVRGNTLALAPQTVSRIVAWMEQTCP